MPKRHGKQRTIYEKVYAKLTDNDRKEVDRFRELLHDKASLPEAEWRAKHHDYITGETQNAKTS